MTNNGQYDSQATSSNPLTESMCADGKSSSPLEELSSYDETITSILEEDSANTEDKELITVVVDMEDGRQETIVVHCDDDVDELTREFAAKHELSEDVLERLRLSIKENIDAALNESESNTETSKEEIPAANEKNKIVPILKKDANLSKYFSKNTKAVAEGNKQHDLLLNNAEVVKTSNRKRNMEERMKKRKKMARSFSSLESRLLNKDKLERLEALRQDKMKEEIAKCTFKPKLNRISLELATHCLKRSMSRSESTANKFELLFDDARRRRYLKEHQDDSLNTECTFKPDIKVSQQVTRGILAEKKNRSCKPYTNIDQTYRPKTGRGPKVERRLRNISIGDYLYMQGKKRLEQLTSLEAIRSLQEWENCNKSYVQDESKKIVENMKLSSFREIFNALDQDSDGLISIDTICTSSTLCMICRTAEECVQDFRADIC